LLIEMEGMSLYKACGAIRELIRHLLFILTEKVINLNP